MGMTAGDVALVAAEARQALAGMRLRRVDQPGPEVLCLSFSGREKRWLFASADNEFCRVHLARGRAKGDPPRRLGQFLRKHAEGNVVESVEQPPGERVLELRLAGEGDVKEIVFELFGRNANFVCLGENREILDALRHIRGGRRSIVPGATYALPRSDAASAAPANPSALRAESASAFFEAEYAASERERETERLREQLARRAIVAREKAAKAISSAEKSLRAAKHAEQAKREGELLKINLWRVEPGADSIDVDDVFEADAPARKVRLDPALSPQQNMQALFKKARKLERGAKEAAQRRAKALGEAARAESLARRVARAGPEELLEINGEFGRAQADERNGPGGPRRFRSADGWEIMVGRNAAENDRLTFRLAKGNDWWLHVRGASGSHVVIAAPSGKPPPQETLVDAATLAAHFSAARGRGVAEIEYTQAKHVRKPRKAAPGAALVTRGKTMRLRLEKPRLSRLLAGKP